MFFEPLSAMISPPAETDAGVEDESFGGVSQASRFTSSRRKADNGQRATYNDFSPARPTDTAPNVPPLEPHRVIWYLAIERIRTILAYLLR